MDRTTTLDTLANGALLELFNAELTRVLTNIQDPNTAHNAKRGITLTISFKASEQRDVADISVASSCKLAGIKPVSSVVFIGRQNGKLVAVESNPKQQGLFDPDKPAPLAAVAPFQPPAKE